MIGSLQNLDHDQSSPSQVVSGQGCVERAGDLRPQEATREPGRKLDQEVQQEGSSRRNESFFFLFVLVICAAKMSIVTPALKN